MNKKVLLVPLFVLSLGLAGCKDKNKDTPKDEPQPAQKQIWEEDLVEGEVTIAQAKEAEAGSYVKLRGTVAANSGSTFSLYRNGAFIYCYNFKAGESENLGEHKLGTYVEVYGQTSEYTDSIQLTAYDVGTEKTDSKYDKAARVTKLADQGETVVPLTGDKEEDFGNARAAGAMMKVNLVPNYDYELDLTDTSNNQNINGKVGEADVELRLEKYLPADTRTAIFAAQDSNKFEMSATYEVTALAAATSGGTCRLMFVDSATWRKTADANFDAPTGVTITAAGGATTVEAKQTLQLTATVAPETAKPIVSWTSEHPEIATVNKNGTVKGVAEGTTKIFAASVANPEIKGEYTIQVTPAAQVITKITTPQPNTKYKLGINQVKVNEIYFGTGVLAGNFGGTTTNANEAADYELVPVDGGYNIKVTLSDASIKYMNALASGKYFNVKYEDTASTVWTFNEAAATIYTVGVGFTGTNTGNNDINWYCGSYAANTTLSLSKASFIEGENAANIETDGGQYPAHFYTVA